MTINREASMAGGSPGTGAGRLISQAVGFAPAASSREAGWRSAGLFIWRGHASECVFPQLDEPVVVYHTGGAARVPVRYRGRDHAASHPGLFTFVPPATPITWEIGGAVHSYTVHLAARCFDRLLEHDADRLLEGLRFRCAFSDALLGALIEAMATEAAGPSQLGSLFADSLADSMALHLARAPGGPAQPGPRASALSDRALRRVIDRIEDGIETGVSLQALADEVGLSRAHFATAFRRAAGVTPHRYLTNRRISVAREKLAASREAIADIALNCGFSSQAHFTECFRRTTGLTPGAYRRLHA
jgi:AraC family transcriptional regulator